MIQTQAASFTINSLFNSCAIKSESYSLFGLLIFFGVFSLISAESFINSGGIS